MQEVLGLRIRRTLLVTLVGLACTLAVAADSDNSEFKISVQPGDTLPSLGKRWLDDPKRWPDVQRHNRIRNPNRLAPGSSIAIPLVLLRGEAAEIVVRTVSGRADNGDGTPVVKGAVLREGASIKTAQDGYVTIQLIDGSTLGLQSRSDLTIERARRMPGSGATDSRFQMRSGRAEILFKPSVSKASRFEIRNDFASAAVLGTSFRVASGDRGARTEVIEGSIVYAGVPPTARPTARPTASGDSVSVPEGYGSIVDASRKPLPPLRLLAAPGVSRVPVIQYTPTLQYRFAPVEGAVGYRARLAADADFERVVREAVSATPEVSFRALEAGSYILKVRAIDRYGLEGGDGTALIGILNR